MPESVRARQSLSDLAIRRMRRKIVGSYHVHTKNQAFRFIHDMGYCYAFTPGRGNLPSLFEVLDTRSDDRRWAWAWDWKEALPSEKRVVYGRVLRGKPTFISMEFVPHFFALTGNVGEPDDYGRPYASGRRAGLGRCVWVAGVPGPEGAAARFEWPASVLTPAIGDLRGRGSLVLAPGPDGKDRLVSPAALLRLTTGKARARSDRE